MSIAILTDPAVQDFITRHEGEDVKALALKKWPDQSWPRPLIIDQIKARQKARLKIPQWFEQERPPIFPDADTLEQASSSTTALYKASLFKGKICIDLTAGCGIDSWALGQNFDALHCVEHNPQSAACLSHNFKMLHPNAHIHTQDAERFIQTMPQADLVYIDPQRRNQTRRGIFTLAECTPDIHALLPILLERTANIMIKASPMLDIDAALKDIPHIHAVHVIEWDGQCKEILLLINNKDKKKAPDIHAVRLTKTGALYDSILFTKTHTDHTKIAYASPQKFLYEPAPAYQKADAMQAIAEKFALPKLAPDTNLFTGQTYHPDFPGRAFTITGIHQAHRKNFPFTQANLTVRNFPDNVENLRKKLKLKDGGDTYLFACTLENGDKVIISGVKTDHARPNKST